MSLAGSLESYSEHPIAKAIVDAMKEKGLTPQEVDQFVAAPGMGIRGVIAGKTYRLGKLKPPIAEHLLPALSRGETIIQLTQEQKTLAYFTLADTLKPTSKQAVATLQKLGKKVVMLTGDLRLVAEAIGKEVGVNEVIAEVMPDQKDGHIQRLQQTGHRVAMVGDGINDAPALVRADVGFAIGAGTDIAIESADIILLQSDLMQVVTAIALAKQVVKTMKTNLFWAFIYNLIAIPLAAGILYSVNGWLLNPMIAAGAMALSSVSVVLNALRLRGYHPDHLGGK